MNLYMPQWQGAGASPAIAEGAARVRAACEDVGWTAVAPFTAAASATEHGIQNYRSIVANLAALRAMLEAARPERLVVLGGDCGIDVVPIGYHAERHGDALGVVWIDAHADLNTPASSPSGTFHGMPLRALLGDADPAIAACIARTVTPAQVVLAGVRDLDPPEADVIAERGLRRCAIGELAAVLGPRRRLLYVHVDLDVLDPTGFTGVACPTAGGVTPAALRRCLEELVAAHDVVGASVLEYVGDRPDETAFAAGLVRVLATARQS